MTDHSKGHGLILNPATPDNWVLGGFSGVSGEVINITGDWTPWMPEGERQIRNEGAVVETNACTVFGTLNALETLLAQRGIKVNYSDRYVAAVAKQKGVLDPSVGADPHQMAEIIRKVSGQLREEQLPFGAVSTKEEYYDVPELTTLLKEGVRWYDEWELSHERVFIGGTPQEKHAKLKEALTKGTVAVSVYAWVLENGKWVKPPGAKDNHWVFLPNLATALDTYIPYVKPLEPLYDFSVAIVYYLTPIAEKLSLIAKILQAIKEVLGLQAKIIDKIKEETPTMPLERTETPVLEPKRVETIKDMVRRVCREEGLNNKISEQLYATIGCESGFDPQAKNVNRNGTTDWGIIQANDYWYIGPGKPIPSVDVALSDPEFCVRVMARQFKSGKARDWICWRILYDPDV